jgi:hypothetical protein
MNSIEQLFSLGYVSDTVEIKGVTFTLTTLDSKRNADALNASVSEKEETARNLMYRMQVLSRAVTSINGVKQFNDIHNPTNEEISKSLSLMEKFHYSVITTLYDKYQKLDDSVSQNIEEEVKK